MFENGRGVARDYAEAVRWYQLAAAQGNAEAEYYLGDMYCQGKGATKKNKDEAMKWWQLAATHGHHGATQKLKLNKNCD